jgi:hypothetical protein
MIVRKFHIIYGHPLFAALLLGLVTFAFLRDRILTVCLAGSGPYVLFGTLFVGACDLKLGFWAAATTLILWLPLLRPVARARGIVFAIYVVFAGMCVVIVGSLFFNIPGLPHAQFRWGALHYMALAAWSLALVALPAGALYVVSRLSGRSVVTTNALSGSRPRRHNIQYREIQHSS